MESTKDERIDVVKGFHSPDIRLAKTTMLGQRASAALEMITRWGMVAGDTSGEDSAGRAKIVLQPIETVVERAITCVDLAWSQFESKGWLLKLPTKEQAKEILDNQKTE